VIRPIAVGGMAELYLTRTVGLEGFEKLACVKRILPEYTDDPGFVTMFLGEARLAATLHHPNIAQVYDIGHEHGEFFFSMEYVHGEDLGRLVAASNEYGVPISLDCALTIAAGLSAGLHHAHDKTAADGKPLGVVHRDVSPTNVLVSYDGAVKLVDFGIARAGGDPSSMPGLKGKISYMSPEQARGRPLDRRSDVFSVGTILYELTTGQLPFVDKTEFGVLQRIIHGQVEPPSAVVPDYPAALEAIVMQALALDPDRRFPTALALQNQIEDFAHDNRIRVSPLVLARVMSALFPARLEEWDHARAQGAFFVEQHVVRTLIESGRTADGSLRVLREGPEGIEGPESAEPSPVDPVAPTDLAVPQPSAEDPTQRGSGLTPEDLTQVSSPAWQAAALDEIVTTPASHRPPPRTSLSGTMPSLSQASSVRMRPSPQTQPPPLTALSSRPHSATIPSLSQASSVRMRPSPSQVLPPPGASQMLPPAPLPSMSRGQVSAPPAKSSGPHAPDSILSSMQLASPASQTLLPQISPPQPSRAGRGSRGKQPPASGSSPSNTMVGSPPAGASPVSASLRPHATPADEAASSAAPYSSRPVPMGGTLVSSATQAGKPPPAVRPQERSGRGGDATGSPGRSPQKGKNAPRGSDARMRVVGGGIDARSGLDDVTDRVRPTAQATLMIRHRRWRPPFIAVALVGVVGAVMGIWLGLRTPQASPPELPRSPAEASREAVTVPTDPPDSAAHAQGDLPHPSERAVQDTQPAAQAQSTGKTATTAAPALRETAGTSELRGDGPATRKTRNAQLDPRGKPAKKRAESRRPKRQPKEQTWNDDSPFMPVATPPR
jgi:serine/threonine protein kinase